MAEGSPTDSAKKPRAKKRKKPGSAPAEASPDRKTESEEASTIDQLIEQAAGYSWVAPLIVIAAAVTTGFLTGFGLGLLVAAGGTMLIVIGLLWASLQGLTENSPLSLEEALSLGAPSAEEEKKRAVLRTLKDLDFERAVGKISEEDYRQLSTRYRAEARDLLRALDGDLSEAREDATAMMEAHFTSRGIPIPRAASSENEASKGVNCDAPDSDEASDDDAPDSGEAQTVDAAGEPVDDPVDDAPEVLRCPSCDTRNDDDARFCKSCGATMEEA